MVARSLPRWRYSRKCQCIPTANYYWRAVYSGSRNCTWLPKTWTKAVAMTYTGDGGHHKETSTKASTLLELTVHRLSSLFKTTNSRFQRHVNCKQLRKHSRKKGLRQAFLAFLLTEWTCSNVCGYYATHVSAR